jgi:beta-galactosidase
VATYIPWLWHELPDGSVDLTGRTDPRRDLVRFLDLAAARGLGVIARPGPFVMAELKNEGIPHRVYDKTPEVWPTTWDGRRITTRTTDYLAPPFLEACRGWYDEVMPLLAERQWSRGGPVTAVQLDNEVGMLSWVTNSPDLTDVVCEDHRAWARDRYGDEEATARTGADARDADAWAARLRHPDIGDTLALHHDLGLYMRHRYARYIDTLRGYAEELGVTDVPFLVNIHGTGGGRGRTFPIGISQLFESYRGKGQITSGSDHYIGDLTVANVGDLYTMNAFMAAVHDADQPLTSLEFEAGSGDYGEDLSMAYPPEAVDLKTRLCVAQGNRLVNYYLFAGGTNPPLDAPVGDGNDRIAFTGERHGFAAPVGPEGQDNPTLAATRGVVAALRGVGHLLADMDEEDDGFALGFVPDHYLTEYTYPASDARAELVADLERFRGMGPRDILVRALLLTGTSFPAVDLQAGRLDPGTTPTVVLAGASALDAAVQQALVDYVHEGGRLLLNGVLPVRDLEGRASTVLADGLGISVAGRVDEGLDARGLPYYPSVLSSGWAGPRAEVRVGYAQLLDVSTARDAVTVLTERQTGAPCGVQVVAGAGSAVVVACDFPSHLDFWRAALDAVGVTPRWQLEASRPGVVVTSTADARGQRLLHLVHVGPAEVDLSLRHRDTPYLGGRRIRMPARSGLVLPAGVDLEGGRLMASTCEIVSLAGDRVLLRPTQPDEDVVLIRTDRTVRSSRGTVATDAGLVTVTVPARAGRDHGVVEVTLG